MSNSDSTSAQARQRFATKYTISQAGCWEWSARRDRDGYGRFSLGGKMMAAHRVSWTIFHGEIPDGLHVLHRCDNPCCVNPEHLFTGTRKDNMSDCAAKGRIVPGPGMPFQTHCKRGHEFTPETVYYNNDGKRRCLPCLRQRTKERVKALM